MCKKNIKAVVFDMDGVLLDSERITRIMWAKAGEEYGIDDVAASVKDCTGAARPFQYAYLRRKYGEDFPAEEFRQRCSHLFHEYADANGLPRMTYAKEILEYLKERGYVLALASSTNHDTVERELKEAGLIDFFETITCGDQVKNSKPHPEIYLTAAESIGVAPEDCAAVEDSPNGIRSCHAAGMKSIMVVDQIEPTEDLMPSIWKLCRSLKELEEIL